MCHRLVCARQVSLGTFLPALPICPHGHPHTWVLRRAASMKMMLSFLLMAISQVLSLELALIHCIHTCPLQASMILCAAPCVLGTGDGSLWEGWFCCSGKGASSCLCPSSSSFDELPPIPAYWGGAT